MSSLDLLGKRGFTYQELQLCTKPSFNTPHSRKNPVKRRHRDSKLLFRISTKSCGKRRAQPKSSAVCAFGAGIHHRDSLPSAMPMVLMHRASVSLLSICPALPEQAERAVDTGSAAVTHLVNYLEPDDLIARAECSRPISWLCLWTWSRIPLEQTKALLLCTSESLCYLPANACKQI